MSGVSCDSETVPTLATLRRARAQADAVQRWLRVVGPLLFNVVVVLTAFLAHPGPGGRGRGLVVSLALVGFTLGVVGLRSTRKNLSWVFGAGIFVMVASSGVLMWAQPNGPGSVGVFLGVLLLARRLPRRTGIILAVVAFVCLATIAAVTHEGTDPPTLAITGGFIGMMFLAARLGQTNEQAEQLLLQLEESRAAEAQAAGLAERQRLAREMHDVLAHSLSGLMLQLEGARMLAAEEAVDPRLRAAIDRAHHLAKTGLEEARQAIGMLRDDELPGPERLAGLAAQFQEDRGIPIRFTVSGDEHELRSEARLSLYRVAQEALTNIAKHAHPDRVELHLAYEPSATRLTVEDFTTANGTPRPPTGDVGYGLTGMRERAELLGGTLITEATGSGFRVQLDVPA